MKASINFSKAIRSNFIKMIKHLSLEELNQIPAGFKNNIFWNFAHIVVTGEALAYIKTEIDPCITIPFLKDYVNGSVPTKKVEKEEVDFFIELAYSSLDKIAKDIDDGKFEGMTSYSTQSFGIANATPEALLTCIVTHDSLHLGYAKALLKCLS